MRESLFFARQRILLGIFFFVQSGVEVVFPRRFSLQYSIPRAKRRMTKMQSYVSVVISLQNEGKCTNRILLKIVTTKIWNMRLFILDTTLTQWLKKCRTGVIVLLHSNVDLLNYFPTMCWIFVFKTHVEMMLWKFPQSSSLLLYLRFPSSKCSISACFVTGFNFF